MGTGDIYLTREGYKKLIGELEHLKKVKRRELAKEVGEAREHGDLTENAEYDSAKEAQSLNERRIIELESQLSRAQIVDDMDISKDEILLGATVMLSDLDSQEEMSYTLVSELEADYEQGKISVSSPVGNALLGHKENDVVEIKIPAGTLRYKVLKISRG